MDEGSALLSMDEQEEAFVDTSNSNGNSPGKAHVHQDALVRCQLLGDARRQFPLHPCHWQAIYSIFLLASPFSICVTIVQCRAFEEESLIRCRHEEVVTCHCSTKRAGCRSGRHSSASYLGAG